MADQWERWRGAFDAAEEPAAPAATPRRATVVARLLRRHERASPWQRVPREHQRPVVRALRTGELLRDPEQARSVLRVSAHRRRLERRGRRLWLAVAARLAFAVWLAVQAVLALRGNWGRGVPSVALILPLFWIGFELWGLVRIRGAPARLAHADRIHREYLERLGQPLPDVDAEAAASPTNERSIRWFFWLLAGLVVVSVVLVWVAQR